MSLYLLEGGFSHKPCLIRGHGKSFATGAQASKSRHIDTSHEEPSECTCVGYHFRRVRLNTHKNKDAIFPSKKTQSINPCTVSYTSRLIEVHYLATLCKYSHLQSESSESEDDGQSHSHRVNSGAGSAASCLGGRRSGGARATATAWSSSSAGLSTTSCASAASGVVAAARRGSAVVAAAAGLSGWQLDVAGAAEVVAGSGAQVVGDGELDFVLGVGVTEGVPEDVLLAEKRATNGLPVLLGVVDGRISGTERGTRVCPTSLKSQ